MRLPSARLHNALRSRDFFHQIQALYHEHEVYFTLSVFFFLKTSFFCGCDMGGGGGGGGGSGAGGRGRGGTAGRQLLVVLVTAFILLLLVITGDGLVMSLSECWIGRGVVLDAGSGKDCWQLHFTITFTVGSTFLACGIINIRIIAELHALGTIGYDSSKVVFEKELIFTQIFK